MKTQTHSNKSHNLGARIDDAKQFTPTMKKMIREHISANKISFVGNSTQVQFRVGFFYRMGGSTFKTMQHLSNQLQKLGFDVYALTDYDATSEHYNAWPKDSYSQVTFMLNK